MTKGWTHSSLRSAVAFSSYGAQVVLPVRRSLGEDVTLRSLSTKGGAQSSLRSAVALQAMADRSSCLCVEALAKMQACRRKRVLRNKIAFNEGH